MLITDSNIKFSVLMPTYNQASFIRRAIASLLKQTYPFFELIIINDGSTDNTEVFISDYLHDKRVSYIKNDVNWGLGKALNQGLEAAKYEYITYLPSDDFYDEDHLESFKSSFQKYPNAVLSVNGIRYDESNVVGVLSFRKCKGAIPGYSAQLVQAAHRRTAERWTERMECVSEDLFFLFWRKLACKGMFVFTGKVTCEWTNHLDQHHKICGERFGGGLNKYRSYYNVQIPIRFRSTSYKTIDEPAAYLPYQKSVSPRCGGLKILIVGELAYNPERIYAFEEVGHKLYGLWAKPRFCYSTIGPLPFGHVETIPYQDWKTRVRDIQPDIIYAQLSTSAIDIAHEVLMADMNIPFVWHFKEGPHEAMKEGMWSKLIDLYTYADGKIYLNPEIKEWFDLFTPILCDVPTMIMDGDLPKAECFQGNFSPKLSATDGELHTVVTGRIIGLPPTDFRELAANGIHLHVYNENYISDNEVLEPYRQMAPYYFHVHRHCSQSEWVKEFSRYDAGWLHCINSTNDGSLFKATWADLNLPARINTLAAAGIPMIQKQNSRQVSAQYSYVMKYGMGIAYTEVKELIAQLKNSSLLEKVSQNVMLHRKQFMFDSHLESLIQFFKKVIDHHHERRYQK
jgi:glycosyltransferase involved in cell wall biosynthesis